MDILPPKKRWEKLSVAYYVEEEALQLRSRVCCGDFNHVWNVSETIGRNLGSSEMEITLKREAKK